MPERKVQNRCFAFLSVVMKLFSLILTSQICHLLSITFFRWESSLKILIKLFDLKKKGCEYLYCLIIRHSSPPATFSRNVCEMLFIGNNY